MRHIKNLTFLLLIIFPFVQVMAQKESDWKNKILKECRRIDLDSNLKMANVVDDKSEKNKINGFLRKDKIIKIISKTITTIGTNEIDFYYSKGKLIYVHETDAAENKFDGQYFFVGNKLSDMISTGHNRFENDKLDPERYFLEKSNLYKNLIRKANNQ